MRRAKPIPDQRNFYAFIKSEVYISILFNRQEKIGICPPQDVYGNISERWWVMKALITNVREKL